MSGAIKYNQFGGNSLILTVEGEDDTPTQKRFVGHRHGRGHLLIDPFSGTVAIQELKAMLYQRKHNTVIPSEIDLLLDDPCEWEQDGYQMEARIEDDDHGYSLGDDEALGEFSEYPPTAPGDYIKLDPDGSEKFILDRAGIVNAYSYGDFEAYWSHALTGDQEDTRKAASKAGMSRGVAGLWAKRNQRMFFERALKTLEGEITHKGVVVTASRAGVEVATESLWGIESDSDSYFNEVASHLAREAIRAADFRVDNLLRADEGLPPRDEVEYITGTGKGDGTFYRVYRSGKMEEFVSPHYG